MPERPPSTAASLSWRERIALSLSGGEVEAAVRLRFAALSAIGLLIGYYGMYNQWVQVAWMAGWTCVWLGAGGLQEFLEPLRADRWMRCLFGLMLLMLVRSSLIDSPGLSMTSLWQGWLGSGLMMTAMLTLWHVARAPRAEAWLSVPVVSVAALAAGTSILFFYVMDSEAVFGARLQNWLIYGGWNSVCTGMTFGMAAQWASCRWISTEKRPERACWLAAAVLLIFATLLTMSRGAVLALSAGHVAWGLAKGWRAALKPALLLVCCTALFQCSAPLISYLAKLDVSEQTGVSVGEVTHEMLADTVVDANPAGRAIQRADNGRLAIYTAALGSMTTWRDWLLGKGLWAENDFWSCALDWYPEHLHSIYMDTLVRCGVPGLLGLLAVLAWGWRRAFDLARVAGEPVWFVLAAYGAAGVIFDGSSAFSMLTSPRFEMLLLWVPVVIASARWTALQAKDCSRFANKDFTA